MENKNLTLNPEKCQFRMDKVVFMRLLVSKYGTGPTEEKVLAVLEPSRQTTPTDGRLQCTFYFQFCHQESLYERSPGREYPSYGAVSRKRRFRN